MKIAIIGEGKNDYGQYNQGTGKWEEGVVQEYLRKIIDIEGLDFNSIDNKIIEDNKNNSNGTKRFRSGRYKFKGTATKLYGFIPILREEKFDMIIFYADSDKEQGTKNTEIEIKKRFIERYDEIKDGLNQIQNEFEINGVPMIAVRMIENWLLADENSYKINYGEKPKNPKLPKTPELIWGDKLDTESNYPKKYIKRVLKQYDTENCTKEYIAIAKETDLNILSEKCNISFAKFYNDIKEII